MIVAVSGSLLITISFVMNHLGAKPESGGRPPRDRRAIGVRAVNIGMLNIARAKPLMLRAFKILSVKKMVEVTMRYRTNARKARAGVKL